VVVVLGAATARYGWAQTGQMPMPDNHQVADFLAEHGQSAKTDATFCAVCHAREYCSRCHVNAARVPAIQGLPSDPAVADYVASKTWPAPASHTPFFRADHRALAASATASCETCHVLEQQCQSCHSGSASLERGRSVQERRGDDLYHPANFVQQHAAAAFNQETECASCHNPEVFCRNCHTGLGRGTDGRTTTGFHNQDPDFALGHGQPARQGLESCAACHAQQDCLQCHSAKAGRRINPHGPDFDPEQLSSKNRQMCLICHFTVPGEP
jgi:hypothetical protein